MADSNNPIQSLNKNLKSFKKEPDLSQMVYGKIMPQAVPLEEAVLGAIMLDTEGLPKVIEILNPESFYLESHQEIYRIMMLLFEKSKPVDLLTVHEELKKAKKLDFIGGVQYLVGLSNKVSSSANIEYHGRIITQKYVQRELIRISTETIKNSYEDSMDIFELLDEAEQNLYEVTDSNLNTGFEALSSLAVSASKEIEEVSKKEGLTGVPTGFEELDKMTSGWQPSDLIIIAARPGMGKTAFTLSLARNAALQGKPVAIFSLEMAKLQLVQRLIAMESEINSRSLRNGSLDDYEWEKMYNAVEKMSEIPIYIDDTPAINIFELRAKCRRLKQNHGIEMVVIDYLQLMSGTAASKGNREQEISTISRSLKALAKELNVPVIALSQLSRAVETRGGNKKPQLSDLRESGAIEQDADIVTFIYRPDYYELGDDFDTPKDQAEIILSKHRNGSLGSVFLKFIPHFVKFVDGDQNPFDGPIKTDIEDPLAAGIVTRPSSFNDEENDDIPF